MRLTSIRRRRRRRRRWRQRPEIFRRLLSIATPVGLHPSSVATDHRRFLTTNPGGTPLIIRGKLFRQPSPPLKLRWGASALPLLYFFEKPFRPLSSVFSAAAVGMWATRLRCPSEAA